MSWTPSTVTCRDVTPSMMSRAPGMDAVPFVRKSSRLCPGSGLKVGSGQGKSFSKLMIGKRTAFPAGTSQARVTGGVSGVPGVSARNQTGPDCSLAQSVPLVSNVGLLSNGCDKSHCHHPSDHGAYVCPNALECGGRTPGLALAACAIVAPNRRDATSIVASMYQLLLILFISTLLTTDRLRR